MSEKICLNCAKSLKGRADKKFCDEACRNQYNNQLNSDVNAQMRQIQNILRKNRRILADVLGNNDKIKISQKKLKDLGFEVDYLTNLYHTKTGGQYRYSFEYGILLLEDDMALLVKKNI